MTHIERVYTWYDRQSYLQGVFRIRYEGYAGASGWSSRFDVQVPWNHLPLSTAQAVAQWLAEVMQAECQNPPPWPVERGGEARERATDPAAGMG